MYILFQCKECKKYVAYYDKTSDGHRCNECNGILITIKKCTKKEAESFNIKKGVIKYGEHRTI